VVKRLYERDRILDGQWKYLREVQVVFKLHYTL